MLEGRPVPATDGVFSGETILPEEGSPTELAPDPDHTGSIAIRAWENEGPVFIGFGEDVDENNGFPLMDGETLTFELNLATASLYAVPQVAGDSVRIISIN